MDTFREMSKDYDMTVKAIMRLLLTYGEAVSLLIFRESRLRTTKDTLPLALVTSGEHEHKSRKCFFFCGKTGHIARDCRSKNTGREKHRSVAGKQCF